MSLIQLVPIGQALVAIAVDKIITRDSATPTVIVQRANTALAVAATITDVQNGNAAQAQADFNGVITDPNMDPVIANELRTLEGGIAQEIVAAQAIGNITPVWGTDINAAEANIVAGITSAANTLIAANQAQAEKDAAAAAAAGSGQAPSGK